MKTKNPKIPQLFHTVLAMPLRWYLIGIGALATALRLLTITKASIWHDEGYTTMLMRFDVAEIIARTARDLHPPLYYIIMHGWQSLLGDSELVLRSLSLIFGVATVILVYFLVRRLFNDRAARLATLFAAFGPFIVRYSEEARMYSMAAFLVTFATYLLVCGLQNNTPTAKSWRFWIGYGIIIAASLYTHYFTAFIIPVHIGYALWVSGGVSQLIKNKKWWAANSLGALLFLPWLPVLIGQVTRVQSGFWIPAINDDTLPNTFMQFLAFFPNYTPIIVVAVLALGLFGFAIHTFMGAKGNNKSSLLLLLLWLTLPILLVVFISLIRQPVYVDRYFVFCAVAFYIVLAVLLTEAPYFKTHRKAARSITLTLLIIFSLGIASVGFQAAHKMRDVGNFVSTQFQPGDTIVSAELYTYFDFSYYNKTNQQVLLLAKDPLGGYGETSLIYDKQDSLRIDSYESIPANTKRVWIVGKNGDRDYFKNTPANWVYLQEFNSSDSAVKLFEIRK